METIPNLGITRKEAADLLHALFNRAEALRKHYPEAAQRCTELYGRVYAIAWPRDEGQIRQEAA